jgi:hypothetical protein
MWERRTDDREFAHRHQRMVAAPQDGDWIYVTCACEPERIIVEDSLMFEAVYARVK